MRYILAGLACAAVLYGTSAQAERRIFIIANNADGYGVDRCLASGAPCGVAVATAYCKSRDFAQAQSFHKGEARGDPRRGPLGERILPRQLLRRLRRHRVHPLNSRNSAADPKSTEKT